MTPLPAATAHPGPCRHAHRAFPDAFTLRCFAFEPSDEQIQEDRKGQRNFIMFPPGEMGTGRAFWLVLPLPRHLVFAPF